MIRAVGSGLHAALLLARGRADGLLLLAAPEDEARVTAARSFWAVALCLPAFIALHLLDWAQYGPPPNPERGFALDLMGYVIGWMGFALLSRSVAIGLGRGRHWHCFIAAWNWCNVVQYLMLVAAAIPVLLGAPDWLCQTAWLVAMGWALWLEWFATRLALDLPKLQAAGLVVLDLMLGLLLVGVTASM